MSVILNALKSSDQIEANKKTSIPNGDEGFFCSAGAVVKKELPIKRHFSLPKRTWIMIVVLVVLSVLSLTFKYLKSGDDTRIIPTQIEIVVPQSSVAQKPAASDPAELAYLNGKYDDSLKLYKDALKADPSNAQLHNNLGLIFIKKELFSNAGAEFQKALELDDSCAECFNNFGYLKSLLGESNEAERYFEKAIKISSSYPDPYFNLAVLLEKDGEIGNAVRYYQQFVDLYPNKTEQIVLDVSEKIKFLKGN